MADLAHTFGSDLAWGPGGDLALSTGSQQTVEEILRRLLTNPVDYIWHPKFGVGLGQYVGAVEPEQRVRARVLATMLRDKHVAQSPAPSVTVTMTRDGSLFLSILYCDSNTGAQQSLSFTTAAA